MFQDVDECQSKENTERHFPNEALIYCIDACYFSISWGLQYIENQCEASQVADLVIDLRKNLDKYMSACIELTRDGPSEQIQESVSKSHSINLNVFQIEWMAMMFYI